MRVQTANFTFAQELFSWLLLGGTKIVFCQIFLIPCLVNSRCAAKTFQLKHKTIMCLGLDSL